MSPILPGTRLSVREISQRALNSTAILEMSDQYGLTKSLGSGFFVRPGIVATNYHVIVGGVIGIVRIVGRTESYPITRLRGVDIANDLALVEVPIYSIPVLQLADSNQVSIGEDVWVAGSPKGLEGTISQGIISGKDRHGTKHLLQMTAAISGGNSGGPVLNDRGRVIGVSVSYVKEGQNLNFAIPSNFLDYLLYRSGFGSTSGR